MNFDGLLDGIEFKQMAYALDRDSRKAAPARFLRTAPGGGSEEGEEKRRLDAWLVRLVYPQPDLRD